MIHQKKIKRTGTGTGTGSSKEELDTPQGPKNWRTAVLYQFNMPGRLSCNAFNGVQDKILKRTQQIMHKALFQRNPTIAHAELTKLNEILAFADDTLVYG